MRSLIELESPGAFWRLEEGEAAAGEYNDSDEDEDVFSNNGSTADTEGGRSGTTSSSSGLTPASIADSFSADGEYQHRDAGDHVPSSQAFVAERTQPELFVPDLLGSQETLDGEGTGTPRTTLDRTKDAPRGFWAVFSDIAMIPVAMVILYTGNFWVFPGVFEEWQPEFADRMWDGRFTNVLLAAVSQWGVTGDLF